MQTSLACSRPSQDRNRSNQGQRLTPLPGKLAESLIEDKIKKQTEEQALLENSQQSFHKDEGTENKTTMDNFPQKCPVSEEQFETRAGRLRGNTSISNESSGANKPSWVLRSDVNSRAKRQSRNQNIQHLPPGEGSSTQSSSEALFSEDLHTIKLEEYLDEYDNNTVRTADGSGEGDSSDEISNVRARELKCRPYVRPWNSQTVLGKRWTEEETKALILNIKNNEAVSLLFGSSSCRNEKYWLQIKAVMEWIGHVRSTAQLKAKWKRLKMDFLRQGEAAARGEEPPRDPSPYYWRVKQVWVAAGRPRFMDRHMPVMHRQILQRERQRRRARRGEIEQLHEEDEEEEDEVEGDTQPTPAISSPLVVERPVSPVLVEKPMPLPSGISADLREPPGTALEQLEEEVRQLKNENQELKERITALEAKVTSIEGELDLLLRR